MKLHSFILSILALLIVTFSGCNTQQASQTADKMMNGKENTTMNDNGMMGDNTTMMDKDTTMMGGDTTMKDDAMMMDHKADYAVDMKNFSFTPNMLTAKAGSTLYIKLSTSDGTHNLYIDELNVKSKTLKTGESEMLAINIPADAAGKEYEFYCAIGKHRELGMVGTLKVMK